MVLNGSEKRLLQFRCTGDALSFSLPRPASVDKDVVQDREKPCPQVTPTLKACAPLVGADEGVMHQVLGVDVAARERAGVAAESRELAEHVEGDQALQRHDPYTELEAELIRQGFKAHVRSDRRTLCSAWHREEEEGWRPV